MKLGRRAILILAGTLAALLTVVGLVAMRVVLRAFEEMEERYVRRNVLRARRAVESRIADLDRTVLDWAQWDDTYRFVRDRNLAYVRENLVLTTFTNLRLDALIIVPEQGGLAWGRALGSDGATMTNLPDDLLRLSGRGGPLVRLPNDGAAVAGVIVLSEGPMIVASRPILTSLGRGPARGALIMGRRLDDDETRRISEDLHVTVALLPVAGRPETELPLRQLTRGAQAVVRAVDPSVVAGYGLVPRMLGSRQLMIRVRMERDLYTQGIRTTSLLLALLPIVGVVFAAIAVALLRRQVVARVERLSGQVAALDPLKDARARVDVIGSDELAGLARDINGLISRITESRRDADQSRLSYETLLESMPVGCAVADVICDEAGDPSDLLLLAANTAFARFIGVASGDLAGKAVSEALPGLEPQWIERFGSVALSGEPARFQDYTAVLERHFEVVAFSPTPGQVVAVFQDITERIAAYEAIRASEQNATRLLRQQSAMNALAVALGESRSLTEVYATIHRHVRELVEVFFFMITSYDDASKTIRADYAASADQTYDVAAFPPTPLGEPDTGTQSRVIHSGEPLYTPDLHVPAPDSTERRMVEQDGAARPEAPSEEEGVTARSSAYLPTKVHGKTVGIMQVQSARLDAYTQQDVEMLAGLANVAAVAVQAARLREDLRRELTERTLAERRARELLVESERVHASLLSIVEDERRAEDSLRTSEERFELAFRTSPYAITITRVEDGAFLDVNDGFEAITGYTREEALASSPIGLDLWADPADGDRIAAELRAGRVVDEEDLRFRVKGGRYIAGLFSARVMEVGGETCVLSSINDITERKRVQDALRESEERFRGMYEESPVAYQSLSPDGRLLDVNPAWLALLGHERREALGRPFEEFLTAESGDGFRSNFARFLEAGAIHGAELDLLRKDRSVVCGSFDGVVVRDASGRPEYSHWVVQDVTARKRAERLVSARLRLMEFAASRSLSDVLRHALDIAEELTGSLAGFYHVVAPDQRTLSLQAWSTRTVAEFCTAVGEGLHYPIEDAGVWVDCVYACGPVIHNDYASLRHRKGTPEGHVPVIREMVTPIFRDDRIVAILGVGNKPTDYTDDDVQTVTHLGDIAWEIAERKRDEEDKAELREQLAQSRRIEGIGRLAGGVAHDFNNMLLVMLGTCEQMEGALRSGDPMRAHVARMRGAAERGAGLTRQLLAFSRTQPLRPEPLDLNDMVGGLSDMLDRLIGDDIVLVPALAPDLPAAVTDRGEIEQVLINLVVNSRDAMPDGGTVTIETGAVVLDEAYARTHAEARPGRYVMLAVSDTGIGMDEETRARAFEPFFTTKPAGKGTGLGLAGAYGTVRRSNGSISIYSEPGKGTTVRIYLPETDQAPVMQADRRTEVPASGQGQVVLVVEDRAEIREVLATQLRDLGYRPTLVANGGEAVLAVEEEGLRPDVMLTDVVMPGMGGAVLAERLRRSLPGLKVLFMSGYTDNAIVHHGILDEGVPFIAKPFTKDALGTALAGIVYGALPGTAEGVGRVALLVDDDPYVAEITELALRRRGYTVISARSRQAALDALAGPGFDLVLMDVNVPPASGEQILRDMRDAGCNVPAIMHTGAAETVDLNALRNLGVIGVISKTGNLRAMADEIEALLSNQSDGWRTSADEQEESER